MPSEPMDRKQPNATETAGLKLAPEMPPKACTATKSAAPIEGAKKFRQALARSEGAALPMAPMKL
eukprot:CAMPEP_0181541018 /NCGR_PEP_ID=MMETSP1110-20121109/77188_1 /TAXON_ID=174948 /ORGANISM="Symbiodinium sp., Strain CCMP421" /LENGTH=64 /DNA_ID=CAMNT_0023672683 /DNA_START=901 /DNA_END=1096 /DNA_ORIENTATION=-